MTSPPQQLAPALDIDGRLTEIERSLNLLLNVTPDLALSGSRPGESAGQAARVLAAPWPRREQ
jgi:hypothetical protein